MFLLNDVTDGFPPNLQVWPSWWVGSGGVLGRNKVEEQEAQITQLCTMQECILRVIKRDLSLCCIGILVIRV